MKTKTILKSLFLICVIALSGCGYRLGAVPPAGVKTIYVPMFENLTHRQEITASVTDGIIKRFRTDGTIKITDRENADAVLYGKITGYRTEAVVFDRQDVGEEFRVIITVDVSLVNSETEEIITSGKAIDGQAITQLILNQVEAEKRILPEIIKDLSKNVVESILESAW